MSFSSFRFRNISARLLLGACAVGAGCALALGNGLALASSRGAPLPALPIFLLSVVCLGLGLAAIGETWLDTRESARGGRRRERAWVATYLIVLLAVLGVAAGEFRQVARLQSLPAPTRIAGEVEHLHPSNPRHGGPRVALKLKGDPHWLTWTCDLLCAPYDRMKRLGDAPWPHAEADVYGRRLVGLALAGQVYLTPQEELARQMRETTAMGVLLLLLAGAMVAGGLLWLKGRPSHYVAPDASGLARARALLRRRR